MTFDIDGIDMYNACIWRCLSLSEYSTNIILYHLIFYYTTTSKVSQSHLFARLFICFPTFSNVPHVHFAYLVFPYIFASL